MFIVDFSTQPLVYPKAASWTVGSIMAGLKLRKYPYLVSIFSLVLLQSLVLIWISETGVHESLRGECDEEHVDGCTLVVSRANPLINTTIQSL